MKAVVDSVEYVLDKPGVAEGSCAGCVAWADAGLCWEIRDINSMCLGTNLVYRKVDIDIVKDNQE